MEKLISGIGGCLAVYAVYSISHIILGDDAFLIVASMGAATVLLFAAAAAVGIAITAMYYLKCIHPPAGDTALSAVISGSAVDALGYHYVLTPVLLNVLVIFSIAVLFNYPFQWRRYPASLIKRPQQTPPVDAPSERLSHEGIAYALREIDSFIDITEEDLNRIYQLASEYDNRQKNTDNKES